MQDVDELINSMSQYKLKKLWVLYKGKKTNGFPILCYQNTFRIYLDEYPEQVELRKEWCKRNTDIYFYQRFLRRE